MDTTTAGPIAPEVAPTRAPSETANAIRARLLAPAMTVWTFSREQSLGQVPRPSDSPQSTVSGVDKLPVLVIGAGPAVGWGVRSHDLALPGSLARALAARTQRGVQVDLVAHAPMTMSTASATLRTASLSRYAAVVVAFSIKDALQLTPVRRWRRQLSALLDQLEADAAVGTPIVITGIQAVRSIPHYDSSLGEIANRHAQRLNQETAAVVRERERFVFVPLVIPAGKRAARHRESGDYVYWARSIATAFAEKLARGGGSALPIRAPGAVARDPALPDNEDIIDETLRQQAVDTLRLTSRESDERIQHLVDVARRALQADSALFGVLDRDRHVHIAESGIPLGESPRDESFCDHTIRRRDGLTVLDARADPRFAHNPWVTSGPQVRFYSGYPVEAPNGQRVGALCVFDSQPRTADEVNVELIEELALLIQRELWRYLPEDER